MQFGRRSEKLDPDQFNLALEDLEQAVAESEAEQEKADPALRKARSEKRRAGRGALPEHLPRVEIVVEPEETACPCCGSAMHVIGEDRSQRLDVIPAQYQVIVTRRPSSWLPMSSSRNMPTTARCTARPRSWRGKALRSIGRPWPSGPATPPPNSNRCGG